MECVRQEKLEKVPGVAETIDWARALAALHRDHLDAEIVADTLGIVFKDWSDVQQVGGTLSELLKKVGVRNAFEHRTSDIEHRTSKEEK